MFPVANLASLSIGTGIACSFYTRFIVFVSHFVLNYWAIKKET